MIPCSDGTGKANDLPRPNSLDGSTGGLAGAAAFIVARNDLRTTFRDLTDIAIALEKRGRVEVAESWVGIFAVVVDEIPAKLEVVVVEISTELWEPE